MSHIFFCWSIGLRVRNGTGMEDVPEAVDNVSTSMGTVTRSGSIRDKMVWRKSRAMLSARWELFLMLPPEREVAFEEALELLREEDIVK